VSESVSQSVSKSVSQSVSQPASQPASHLFTQSFSQLFLFSVFKVLFVLLKDRKEVADWTSLVGGGSE